MNTPPNVQEFNLKRDRDLISRKQICEFPINKQDEIRQAYLIEGPYQPENIVYPYNDDNGWILLHEKSSSGMIWSGW